MGNSSDPNFAVSIPTLGAQGQFCQCGLIACLYFLQSITLDQENYTYPLQSPHLNPKKFKKMYLLKIHNYFGKQEMMPLVDTVRDTWKSEGQWDLFEGGNQIPKYGKERTQKGGRDSRGSSEVGRGGYRDVKGFWLGYDRRSRQVVQNISHLPLLMLLVGDRSVSVQEGEGSVDA